MAIPPIAAIEIGTTRTVVCVGERDTNSRTRITGIGIAPTLGVRKSQISELSQVHSSIVKAVAEAEKASGVDVWQALVAVGGGHIRCHVNTGVSATRSSDHTVTAIDVEEVTENAKDITLEVDRLLLHTIPQSFSVDGQPGVIKPEGMRCKMLKLDMLTIHGLKNRIDNAVTAVKNAKLDVADVIFSGIGAALSTLTPELRRSGVLLIDLGGGSTNYVVYSNGILSAAGCIAVGGDHITNDITMAFNIPQSNAEEIKRKHGSAMLDPDVGNQRVTLPSVIGLEERTISIKALHTVINARMDELLRVLRTILNDAGLLPHLGGGIVLVGGGAYLREIVNLTEQIFGVPCRISTPVNVTGLDGMEQPASFATVAGMVIHGGNNYEERGLLSPVKNLFRGLFSR